MSAISSCSIGETHASPSVTPLPPCLGHLYSRGPPALRRPSLALPHQYLLSCRSRCILFRQFLCHASHWTPRLPRSLARCLFSQRSQVRSAPAFPSRTTVDYPAITDSSCITVTPCRLATSSFWINKTNASPLLTPASLQPSPPCPPPIPWYPNILTSSSSPHPPCRC